MTLPDHTFFRTSVPHNTTLLCRICVPCISPVSCRTCVPCITSVLCVILPPGLLGLLFCLGVLVKFYHHTKRPHTRASSQRSFVLFSSRRRGQFCLQLEFIGCTTSLKIRAILSLCWGASQVFFSSTVSLPLSLAFCIERGTCLCDTSTVFAEIVMCCTSLAILPSCLGVASICIRAIYLCVWVLHLAAHQQETCPAVSAFLCKCFVHHS